MCVQFVTTVFELLLFYPQENYLKIFSEHISILANTVLSPLKISQFLGF